MPKKRAKTPKRGRPSKLTKEVAERICNAVQVGNHYCAAAAYGGITYQTLREWLKKGEKQRAGEFRDFLDAMKKAEADAEIALVAAWRSSAGKNWLAAAAFLERRYPERWARQRTGPEGSAPALPASELLMDETQREAIAAAGNRQLSSG
jgi:hypothetical protein